MTLDDLIEELINAKNEKGNVEVEILFNAPIGNGISELVPLKIMKIIDIIFSDNTDKVAIWAEKVL